jgi:hypothetical protein
LYDIAREVILGEECMMRKEILFKNLQRTIIFQAGFCILVLMIAWPMGWLHPHTIGMVFTCVGASILAVSSFILLTGYILSSWATYSLSGAGKMDKHSKIIEEATPDRPVFLIVVLFNGVILLLIGFLLLNIGG